MRLRADRSTSFARRFRVRPCRSAPGRGSFGRHSRRSRTPRARRGGSEARERAAEEALQSRFHGLFETGRSKQGASRRFGSRTVPAPAKPKPSHSHNPGRLGLPGDGEIVPAIDHRFALQIHGHPGHRQAEPPLGRPCGFPESPLSSSGQRDRPDRCRPRDLPSSCRRPCTNFKLGPQEGGRPRGHGAFAMAHSRWPALASRSGAVHAAADIGLVEPFAIHILRFDLFCRRIHEFVILPE